jgi:ribose transport system substrate-binding protein
MTVRQGRRARYGWLFAGAALVLAACGGGGGGDGDSPVPTGAGRATQLGGAEKKSDPLEQAKANVAAIYRGTSRLPDATPRPAVGGKRIVIISAGQASESTTVPVAGAQAAARALGWQVTVVDGKNVVSGWNGLVQRAVAQRPDGIVLQAIDCGFVQTGLRAAKAAGIPVVAGYSFDCDDPKYAASTGGQRLFAGVPNFGRAGGNVPEFTRQYGQAQGDYLVARLDGKAKVLEFNDEEFRVLDYTSDGFRRGIANASGSGSEIAEYVSFTLPELVNGKLQQKVAAAIARHPEANAVKSPFTFATTCCIAPAVNNSGRKDRLVVMGSEGFASELDLIRAGDLDAANIVSSEWVGWSVIDSLNSVFRGERPVDNGVGWTLVDRDHNLPASGPFTFPGLDWKRTYTTAWGVTR